MVVYGVAAIGVFLVVLWVTRRGFAAPESEPPRQWRLAGWMIWLSLLFGGFSGVSQLTAPLLSSLPTSAQQLVSGAILGGVVALVVRLAPGLDQALGGGGHGRCRPRDLDAHGIMQELLSDSTDFRRHGRGEEQGLPGERHQLADALDVRDEAHVEHAVGLVDDEKLDARH